MLIPQLYMHISLRFESHKKVYAFFLFKGIVSRDWGELQMIPMDKSEVFSNAGSYSYLFFNKVFMFKFKEKKRLRYGIWLTLRI